MFKRGFSSILAIVFIIGMIAPGVAVYGENDFDATHNLSDFHMTVSQKDADQNSIDLNSTDHRILQGRNFTVTTEFKVPVKGDGILDDRQIVRKGNTAKIRISESFPESLRFPENKVVELKGRASDGEEYTLGTVSFKKTGNRPYFRLEAHIVFGGKEEKDEKVFDGSLYGISAVFSVDLFVPMTSRSLEMSIGNDKAGRSTFAVDRLYEYTLEAIFLSDGQVVNMNQTDTDGKIFASEIQTKRDGLLDVTIKAEKRENLNAKNATKEADLAGAKLIDNLDGDISGSAVIDSFTLNGRKFSSYTPPLTSVDSINMVFPSGSVGEQIVRYQKRQQNETVFGSKIFNYTREYRATLEDTLSYVVDGETKTSSVYLQNVYHFNYQTQAFHTLSAEWLDGAQDKIKWIYETNLIEKSLEELVIGGGFEDQIIESGVEYKWEGGNWIETGQRWDGSVNHASFSTNIDNLNGKRRYVFITRLDNLDSSESQVRGSMGIVWKNLNQRLDISYDFKVRRNSLTKQGTKRNNDYYRTTWNIMVDYKELEGLNHPTFYDLMIFDRDFYINYETANWTEIKNLPAEITEKMFKALIQGRPKRHLQKYLADSFVGSGVNKKVVKVSYQNRYVADLLIVTGPTNQNWGFSFDTYPLYGDALFGDYQLKNEATIFDGQNLMERKTETVSYFGFFNKQAVVASSLEAFYDNPIGENIVLHGNGQKMEFNHTDRTITYAIQVNGNRYGITEEGEYFGTEKALGVITLKDELPDGWEFIKLPNDKAFMIFENIQNSANHVATGSSIDTIEGMTITSPDFIGKQEVGFRFDKEIDKSYLILLRAKPNKDWWKEVYKNPGEKQIKNIIRFSSARTNSAFDQHISKANLQILKKSVTEDALKEQLNWKVEFNPLELNTNDPEMWMIDTLPHGLRLLINPDGSLKEGAFKLEKAAVNVDGSLKAVEEVALKPGENFKYEGGQLKVKLPKDGQPYIFTYITGITKDTPDSVTNKVELPLRDVEIRPATVSYRLLRASGTANYQLGAWLEAMKIDKESKKPLSGVGFQLIYQNGAEESLITDKDGLFLIKNLPAGIHTLKETRPLPEYQSIGDLKIEVKNNPSGTSSVFIEGVEAHGLLITNSKVPGNTSPFIPLPEVPRPKVPEVVNPTPETPQAEIPKPKDEIEDDGIPQGKDNNLPKNGETDKEIDENGVPRGNNQLPQTSGIPLSAFLALGLGFVVVGKIFKISKN